MMPVEQQVCSYALAQRLAELGVRQESVCWWVDRKVTYSGGRASHTHRQGGIAAFTVAELGAMLPDEITIPAKNGTLHTHWLRFGAIAARGTAFGVPTLAGPHGRRLRNARPPKPTRVRNS